VPNTSPERRDFFISYNHHDAEWATWIAWTLEDIGFTAFIQDWDFGPGSNFVLEMQKGAALGDRTIAVLSPNYLASLFTQPEWAAAFVDDPAGLKRKLVPIVVAPTQLPGLLAPIAHINFVGVSESDAKAALLHGIAGGRSKPKERPDFPGTRT
jgi:hypothetical protein